MSGVIDIGKILREFDNWETTNGGPFEPPFALSRFSPPSGQIPE